MGKSLFELITEAIVTNTPKDVEVHERPLAAELIDSEKERDPFALYDFLPQSYRGKSLVLTRHLIRLFRNIVLFFIALCYGLYDLLHKVITDKWKSERLEESVRERRVPKKKWIDRLHPEKWRGMKPSSGLNAVILVSTFVAAIISLVFGLHFLIKEVVLPDNACRVNQYGIVTFDQGCLEEQHFFLLNAASFWTATGIAVSKGDKVYVTASGSMYSDIDEMVKAAKDNKELLYPRSSFHKKYQMMDPNVEYCIYGRFCGDTIDNENKPVFGSLLYQIGNEVRGPMLFNNSLNPTTVKQINFAKNKNKPFKDKRYYFKADKSGVLYFSFNDILLDDTIIERIVRDYKKSPKVYKDLVKLSPCCEYCPYLTDVLKTKVDSLTWFKDNIGEALVNIRVEKNVWKSRLPVHKKLLVALYRKMDAFNTKTENGFLQSGLFFVILAMVVWFTVDILISRSLKKKSIKTNGENGQV